MDLLATTCLALAGLPFCECSEDMLEKEGIVDSSRQTIGPKAVRLNLGGRLQPSVILLPAMLRSPLMQKNLDLRDPNTWRRPGRPQ